MRIDDVVRWTIIANVKITEVLKMGESFWGRLVRGACAIGGALAGLFGEWNMTLTILAVMMGVDYVSGLIVAATGRSTKTDHGGLDSKVGFIGLAKKGFMALIVLVATLLDRAIGGEAMVFQTSLVCYYIANEGLSVLENASLLGVPFPAKIKRALEAMREKEDEEKKDKRE